LRPPAGEAGRLRLKTCPDRVKETGSLPAGQAGRNETASCLSGFLATILPHSAHCEMSTVLEELWCEWLYPFVPQGLSFAPCQNMGAKLWPLEVASKAL